MCPTDAIYGCITIQALMNPDVPSAIMNCTLIAYTINPLHPDAIRPLFIRHRLYQIFLIFKPFFVSMFKL